MPVGKMNRFPASTPDCPANLTRRSSKSGIVRKREERLSGCESHSPADDPTHVTMKTLHQAAILTATSIAAGVLLLACSTVSSTSGQWPRWRGPTNSGMADGDAPTSWSDTQNVKWKVEIPGRGSSSPVVWGDQIFLTTAIPTEEASKQPAAHEFVVLCLDRKTGKVLWQRTATSATPHESYHADYGSFASGSPVTDGEHLIADFGSRGVYSYDLDGNLVWKKNLGVQMQTFWEFGEGSAPVLDGDVLLLKFDHEGDSLMVALDKNDGREIWRVERDEVTAWAPPLVVQHGDRKQVITSATNKIRSYDFTNGELIWESKGLGRNVIPAPVIHDDIVFVMSGYKDPNLLAIRLGGEGDITDSDWVLWSNQKANAYTSSPVLDDNRLYVLTDNGFISCYNATTGAPYYKQQRLPKPYKFKASLVGANGKLYLSSEEGDVIVLKMGEQYEVMATNTLEGQTFVASPAIANDELFLRSETALFCIREAN